MRPRASDIRARGAERQLSRQPFPRRPPLAGVETTVAIAIELPYDLAFASKIVTKWRQRTTARTSAGNLLGWGREDDDRQDD